MAEQPPECMNWKRGRWTPDEDKLLRVSVSDHGEQHWRLIAARLPHRSPIQCLHRWTKILKPGLVKGPWSASEDKLLRDWVHVHGPYKWAMCARRIPGRCGKQCREHWRNALDPYVKKGKWTSEEDQVIFQLQAKIGPKWSEIAKQLPGRTENSIKNRFYSTLRRGKLTDILADPETKVDLPRETLSDAAERMSTLLEQMQRLETLLHTIKS